MHGKMKSYLLIKLSPAENPARHARGMVISVRDITHPVGLDEHPPVYAVIFSDRTREENLHLMKERGYWTDVVTNNPLWNMTQRRDQLVDIDAMYEPIPVGASPIMMGLLATAKVGQRLNSEGAARVMADDIQAVERVA